MVEEDTENPSLAPVHHNNHPVQALGELTVHLDENPTLTID